MSASDSDSAVTSAEMAAALPAGIGPGERDVVAGRYKLLEHIADGGMGSVYLAQHTLSRKKLALKVVHPYLCKGRQGVERFRREVSAAAEIEHPGIVQVFDAGVDDDGGFFMAMELLEGESLGDRLRRDWPGMATAVKMVVDMLEPLAKAHAKGFIHRDLKPDNIFLSIDMEGRARVKLLDFGLAREVDKGGPTRTGITFGTPEYMSPEQAMSARKVKSPGDVWSIGVMLYELLSGDHPFQGETPNAIMANAIKEPLPPLREKAPHVPEALAKLVERCLEKEPADRPAAAGQMLEELRQVLEEIGPLDETVPSAPTPPPTWDSSEEEISVSSDFPIPSSRRRTSGVPTEAEAPELIVEPVPSADLQLPQRSLTRPLVVFAFGALLAAIAVLILAVVYSTSSTEESQLTSEPTVSTVTSGSTEPAGSEPVETEPAETDTIETETIETELAETEPIETEPADPEPEPAAQTEPTAASRPSRSRAARRAPDEASEAADPAPAAQPRVSGMPAAQQCLRNNDRRCAITALEGGRRGASETALLIDLYQQTGRVGQAIPHLRRFVARYPDHPRTPEYRRFLGRL